MNGAHVGTRVGPYRLVRLLGRGGMGEVWAAEHEEIRSQVAIKLVLGDPDDEEAAARFLREAKATARVRHPGVVAVSDYGARPEGGAYLVMELLDGESLASRLERGALPIDLAIDVAMQIAEALAAAHASQLVHRDLKPANVFLVPSNAARSGLHVKLLDFGVAKTTGKVTDEHGLTITGALVGTPVYMAPEQCTSRHGAVEPRTDLYALGAVMYEMITGAPPFRGPTLGDLIDQHLNATPTPPRSKARELSAELDRLILAMLAKRAQDRPASAGDVADQLASAAGLTQPGVTSSASTLALDETAASGAHGAAVSAHDETVATGGRATPAVSAHEATAASGGRATPAVSAHEATAASDAATPAVSAHDETAASGARPVSALGETAAPGARPAAAAATIDTATRSPTPNQHGRRAWWIAAAAIAIVGGVVLVLVLRRDAPALDLDAASESTLDAACREDNAGACFALGLRERNGDATPDLTRVYARVHRACELGWHDGCAQAALMLMSGVGMNSSPERAHTLADRSCTAGHASSCDLVGDLIVRGAVGPPTRAHALVAWRRGCQLGAPAACQSVAVTVQHGIGVPRDPVEATAMWARTAVLARAGCDAGDASACRVLATIQLRGTGVPKDETAGGATLLRACELGSIEACGELGEQHALGSGVPKDPDRARQLLERACARGHVGGCSTLALVHASGLIGEADPATAFRLARETCETHGAAYCSPLANLYQLGLGVAKDDARARSYHERACNAGDADACANAALIDAVDLSAAEVRRRLDQACALGSAYGCYQSGRRARDRDDHATALPKFEVACAMSDGQIGCPQLASAYFDGHGVAADPAHGLKILEDGCTNSAQIPCFALGVRLRDGNGVEASAADAMIAFEKACALGWANACVAAAAMLDSTSAGLTPDPARSAELRTRACTIEPRTCAKPDDRP